MARGTRIGSPDCCVSTGEINRNVCALTKLSLIVCSNASVRRAQASGRPSRNDCSIKFFCGSLLLKCWLPLHEKYCSSILYHPLEPMPTLHQQLGQIDIYLFDQLLRSNIMPGMRVLDAGCGPGRNLVYLLREGYEVFASDQNPEAIAQTRALVAALAPHLPAENFRIEPI